MEHTVDHNNKFPYKELVLLVLGSVVITSTALYLWHRAELWQFHKDNEKLNDGVRKEIQELEAYRATLGTTTATTHK